MNNEKLIDMLNHPHTFDQAVELINFAPGAKQELLKMRPGPNPGLRNFFVAVARDPLTDPETLHMLGIRDLPNKIRFAVIDNPNTERRTIERMARQSANDAVRFRAEKFLQANPNLPKDDIMESKFKLSTKEVKKIIREELKKALSKRF